MIPNKSTNVVTGSMAGDSVTMGFAVGAERKLMALLANLYSDPILAVIRELSNNAWDSHVEARQTDVPIEVILPSPLSPYITIRDHGVGLSVRDIHELYSQYGATTKDKTNEQTGFMGVGSKAPLSYQHQFTTIATKDGVRATVSVSVDAEGVGQMLIVDTSSTSDGNGVEVQVPVKAGDVGKFESAAREFFSYWDKGHVLINGKEPKHVGGMVVARAGQSSAAGNHEYTIRLIQDNDYRNAKSKVLMGGVAYPTDKLGPYELGIPSNYAIVAEVPLGAVEIAPSREALTYSPMTVAVLDKIKRSFKTAFQQAIQDEIEKAATPIEAIRLYSKWARVLGNGASNRKWRFKGRDIPMAFKCPHRRDKLGNLVTPQPKMRVSSNSSYKMGSASDVSQIDLSYFEKAIFVTDYDLEKFTATHKRKLLKWVEDEVDLLVSSFVMVNFPVDPVREWLDPKRIVPWATVNAIKLPKKERTASGRLPGSYDVILRTKDTARGLAKNGIAGSTIDQSKPVYWMHGNIRDGYSKGAILDRFEFEYTLVALPANRIDKFVRENPNIHSVDTAIHAEYERWLKSLSPAEKLLLAIEDAHAYNALAAFVLVVEQIDDPEVVAGIAAIKSVNRDKLYNAYRMWIGAGCRVVLTPAAYKSPLDKYLAVEALRRYVSLEAAVEAMNALYAYRCELDTGTPGVTFG